MLKEFLQFLILSSDVYRVDVPLTHIIARHDLLIEGTRPPELSAWTPEIPSARDWPSLQPLQVVSKIKMVVILPLAMGPGIQPKQGRLVRLCRKVNMTFIRDRGTSRARSELSLVETVGFLPYYSDAMGLRMIHVTFWGTHWRFVLPIRPGPVRAMFV